MLVRVGHLPRQVSKRRDKKTKSGRSVWISSAHQSLTWTRARDRPTDPSQLSNVKYQHELLSTHRFTRVSSLQQRPWLNRPPAFRLHDMGSYIDLRHSARYELTCHHAPSIHVCRFNLSEFSPAKKDGQFQPSPFRWHFRILSLPRSLLSEWEDPFGSRQPAQGPG